MTDTKLRPQIIKFTTTREEDGMLIVDLIERKTSLSKSIIKKLMVFGSVFQTINRTRKNVRKAKAIQKPGNIIECYFDPKIDLDQFFEFKILHETKQFGIYEKPVGALTEGTNYGDRISILRHAQLRKKSAYIINRIDKEATGLVVVAYDSKTQNLFQEMWRDSVVKKYQAIVLGKMTGSGVINEKINNKFTSTEYNCFETEHNKTNLEIRLKTERKHQIRIHFAKKGHPVMGDPIYGEHNKNRAGLKLISYSLEFVDPYSNEFLKISIPKNKLLF